MIGLATTSVATTAREVAAYHGVEVTEDEAAWFVANRTAFPFCSYTHMICQLSEHFRSITTKDPT